MSTPLAAVPTSKPSPMARLAAGLRQIAEAVEELELQQAPAPEPRPEDDESLTAAAAAKRLGISKRTVYDLVKRRELGALHIGNLVRIPAKSLETFKRRRLR